jgi:hypothetical protein
MPSSVNYSSGKSNVQEDLLFRLEAADSFEIFFNLQKQHVLNVIMIVIT